MAAVLCGLLLVWHASNARCSEPAGVAAEPTSALDAAPLRYQAVFVPLDRKQEWAPDSSRYRTMSAREFGEKVAAVNTASSLGGDSYGATIRSAEYQARLEDDTLVDGRALLDVGCSVSSPTTLSLAPCGLAIGEASWADKDGETAKLGLNRDEDQLQVWLNGPGKLEFDWSLRGRSDRGGTRVFSLAFPRGPATQLLLELPQGTEPVCPAGVVIHVGAGEEGFRRWRIELGGHHLAQLRLVSVDEADRGQRLPRVRQTTSYHLSSDLATITAELEFDVRHEPLRRITLALDSPLRIVAAELGGKPLDWSVVSSLDPNGTSRVALEPAEPIEGAPRRITIRALAPLQMDGPWRLPRIRPEDVAWRQAEATLRVVRPLVVEQLKLIDARQTSAASTELGAGAEADETIELQYWSADAAVQIVLARREAPVEADTAVAVSLSGSKLVAETVADLRVSLASRSPAYAAKVEVQATVSGHSLEEHYRFECEPQGSRVDRVLIRFSQDRDSELVWTLVGPEDQAVPARSSADEAAGDVLPGSAPRDDDGEQEENEGDETEIPDRRLWEIRLDPPRSVGFVIRAKRTTALVDRQPVCLAGLPEASQQQATLEIRARGSSVVVVDNERLRPIALEKPPFAEYSSLRAAFHYQAQHDMDPSDAPLTISPGGSAPVGPSAWAWRRRLDSRYEASGQARHLVSYRIESAGRERIELTLPRETSPRGVCEAWVNGVATESSVVKKDDRLLMLIDLPSGRRFVEVRVAFATDGPPLALIGPVVHPELAVDMPVLARTWTVWLPPGFKASRETTESPARGARRLSLTERLLGPLGRGAGEKPWTPAPLENWLLAFGGQGADDNAQRKALGLLELMGESPNPGVAAGGEVTWGKLLGHKAIQELLDDTSNGQSAVALIVDQQALDRAGPTVDTPVRRAVGASGAAQGLAMLRDANLSMLVGTDVILLTSAAQAAIVREQLAPLTDETAHHVQGRLPGPPSVGANPQNQPSLDPGGAQRNHPEQRAGSRQSRSPGLNLVWRVRPGPLAEELQRSAGGGSPGAFTLASRWSEQPPPGSTPWRHAYPAGYRPDDVFGWTAYRLEPSGDWPVELVVVNDDMLRCLRWIVMLFVLWIAWWGLLHRPALLTAALGGLAVAALLAPEPAAVLLSGGVLGCLGVFLLRWITPKGRETNRANDSGGSSRRRRRAMGTGVLLAVIWSLPASAPLRAQDPLSEGERPTVHRVFIPLDEQGRETGQDYLVPLPFYDALQRRAARLTEAPRGWLLCSGAYRGKLFWPPGPVKRLAVGPLTAEFYLEVATAGATVRIPLGGDFRYDDDQQAATLDDDVINPQWNEEEGFIEFVVEKTGRRRLEITLYPTTPEGASSGFDLLVPRLATSWLELDIPKDVEEKVEIPQAVGGLKFVPGEDSTRSRLLARLGPPSRNRLEVRWPSGSGNALPNVEELLWLTVEPGSATLEAKFTFQIRDTATQRLSLAVDPALQRLSPFSCDQVVILSHQEDPLAANQSPVVHLNLARPVSNEELVVRARFVVKNCSGVGNLSAPLLETRNTRISSRWLAVSVDPSLQCDYDPLGSRDTAQPVLDTTEFVDAWGEDSDIPAFARVLSAREPTWRLAVRPRDPVTTAEQVLELDYDTRGADVRFDARLTTTVGARFQYRILAPPGLEVEDEAHCVSVLAVRSTDLDGSISGDAAETSSSGNPGPTRTVFGDETTVDSTELVRRCWRAADGAITVFLKSPLRGEHVLSLRGRLPMSKPLRGPRPVETPTFEIDDAPPMSSTIRIFRQPEVKVGLEALTGLSEFEDSSRRGTEDGRGRLVAALQSTDQGPIAVSLTMAENHPKVHGHRTTLLVKADAWRATVEFDLQVDAGVVDEMILITPPWWKPDEASGADIFPIAASDESHSRYRIRPYLAIEGPYPLEVSGRLELAADGAVQIPDATLEGVTLSKSVLVLPASLDLEPTARERGQVRKVDVPQRFSEGARGSAHDLVAYEYQGRSYRAVARPNEAPARVFLADARITLRKDGTCRGVVTFDLEAAGRADCLLVVPDGFHVARIDVSDATPMAVSERRGLWRIPLGSGRLPKRIEVVFWGRASSVDGAGRRRVALPWLVGIPVEQTLWTVSAGAGNPRPRDAGQDEQDVLKLDLLRLRSVAQRIENTQSLADADPAEVAAWYHQWVRYWAAARHEVRRRLADAPAPGRHDSALADLELLEGSQFQLAEALDAEDALAAAKKETPSGRGIMESQLSGPDQSRHTTYYAILDDVDSIMLAPERTEVAGVTHRRLAAAALVGLMFLSFLGARRGVRSVWLRRWPHAIGVAAGLAWWMWLSPSFAGVAIVLASLLALRSGWRYRRRSSSAIVPLGVLDR